MNKIFLISLAMCISLLASETPTRTGTFPDKEMKTQNVEIAGLVAAEISSTLPQVIDKYTTLKSVTSDNSTLVYTFIINTGAKSDETVQKEDHSRMKEVVTTGICQSSSKFLAAGINTSYIYLSAKTSAHLFRFDITKEDCTAAFN